MAHSGRSKPAVRPLRASAIRVETADGSRLAGPARLLASHNLASPPSPKTIVEEILSDERCYGDHAPSWKNQVTAGDAQTRRNKVVKRLRRFSGQFSEAQELADWIDTCSSRRRCVSASCPECTRALQRWFVAALCRIARSQMEKGRDLLAISLVPSNGRAPVQSLNSLDIRGLTRELGQVVAGNDKIQWAALGLDISLNDESQKGHGLVWQAQLYGFLQVRDKKDLARTLSAEFPKSSNVSRPVRVRKFDGSQYATSYALKTDFVRRISYWAANRRYPCWETRKCALKAQEHVELLLMLDRIGFEPRQLFYGLEPAYSEGRVTLKPLWYI